MKTKLSEREALLSAAVTGKKVRVPPFYALNAGGSSGPRKFRSRAAFKGCPPLGGHQKGKR